MNTVRTTRPPMMASQSLEALLRWIVDYAGLFPPAGLDMATAVANYAEYMRGDYSWMLGRFVLPASRLQEFAKELDHVKQTSAWQLSVIIGADVAADLATVSDFDQRERQRVVIDAIEAKAATVDEIRKIRDRIPTTLATFVEIPVAKNPSELVATLADCGLRGKIRTGGTTQTLFPSSEEIARFIGACVRSRVPFKATAGLHHPIRCVRPLTYEADSATALMHGFLNVFIAAALAYKGSPDEELVPVLDTLDPEAFRFDHSAVVIRPHRITTDTLRQARSLAIAFGSCSFTEPIEDLKAIHLL